MSDTGGVAPRWSPDGRELCYRWDNFMYSVRIDTSGEGFRADRPQVVLQGLPAATVDGDFDVLDSERFLVVEPAEAESAPNGVTVVVNWLEDLRRRVHQ